MAVILCQNTLAALDWICFGLDEEKRIGNELQLAISEACLTVEYTLYGNISTIICKEIRNV